MKKKLSSKKCIALILAVVMIITSVPLMMVGAVTIGAYDPAPYWGDDPTDKYGAINTNFVATLNTDGSVDISFPNANAQKTYNGSADKTIDKYVFTLTKLQEDGTRKEIYSEVFTAAQVATGTEGAKYPNNIYYGPGGLESLPDYDVQSTYDVAIMAIDSDGWFSDKIHTLLTDTPYYDISADFSPNETWVAREMLLFEGAGSADINAEDQGSSTTADIDYKIYSGSALDTNGAFAETGYEKSQSYRFWINSAYDGTPYSVQTTWSRSHYNFENAEEAWFYVDFSRVDFAQVAFSLTANEKRFVHWKSGSEDKTWSRYGDLFSTKSVAGVNTGVKGDIYIQNADGLWEETTMTDGYLTDLAGYEGFIRIPIEYFVLQTDQYINARNTVSTDWDKNETGLTNYANSLLFRQDSSSGIILELEDGTQRTSTAVTMTFDINDSTENKDVYQVLVNPKGTPVTDALIIYDRFEKFQTGALFWEEEYTRGTGKQLHTGTTVTETANADGKITYKINDGIKAIEDLCSAGIEVANWSADSVTKSFYIDQVMFCQWAEGATFNDDGSVATTSSVKFPDEGGDFAGDLGKKIAGYYDRTVEVPKAVANYITEYVGKTPSLDDVNALEMINEIILTYRQCFPTVLSTDNDTATLEKAITYLNTLGYTDAYNRYVAAKTFIETYINLGDTARNYNAVIAFESGVELLPDPEFANYNDEELKAELEQLMALYKSFNLSHFEILGAEAENKFTELYSIMMGEEVKTGYSIGGYPYIPFNDFEKNISGYNANYSLGQLSLQYYDDSPRVGNKDLRPTDVNNTKNLVTYVTPDIIPQSGQNWIGNAKAVGWSVADYRATADNLLSDSNEIFDTSDYFGRMDAEISNSGFAGSQGVQINLDGDITTLDADDNPKFATVSTTYKGQNVNTWTELQGLNLAALQLTDTYADGTTAKDNERYGTTSTGEQVTPNSFVMYVDFSEVTNIAMNIKFILNNGSGTDVNCYFCGGSETATPTIYVLDENGEWTDVQIAVSAIDTSSTSFAAGLCSIASAGTPLEGYKGFIRIPLSMFRIPKRDGLEENYLILENNLNNYTIAQAKVSFWDYDTEDKNIGTEINIDAMGFTYDPNCATRILTTRDAILNQLNSDNGLSTTAGTNIKNMDEYFGVKTNDSVNFEKMVAELDPYEGKDAFVTAYNNAKTAYDKLSFYQKGLDEIKHSYDDILIGKYRALADNNGANYETLMAQEPWVAKYATASELLTDLNALDSKATSFDITKDENALTKPYNTEDGTITYTDLGIADKAAAEAIVEMYEKGYRRLSGTEKTNLSADDLTKLENAYAAAKRLLLLEDYITDMNSFKNEIIQIYTVGTAEPDVRMVSYANPDLLEAIDHYEDMSVFAKQMLSTTKDTANAGYPNMYAAAEAIYDNSHTITMSIGTAIDGGVLVFEERMHTCATDVAEKIRTRTVLDDATLNEIEYCLGQTESFLQRYAQVDEINVAYHELADLLPVADIASVDSSNAELTKITLNNDSAETMKCTAYIDLSYIATRLNRSVDLYAQSSLKWTQTGGSTYNAFEDLMYNSATAESLADYQNADGIVTALVGSYTNGNSASLEKYPYEISVDATEAAKVPTGATYTGKVTFYAVDSALVAEKTADGTDVSTVLADAENVLEVIEVDVEFQSTNGTDPIIYEVEIPAKVQVAWDTTDAVDVSYSVEATLGSNTLSVGVSGTDKLINDDTRVTYELAYSKANFVTETFTGDVATGTKPTNAPSITIKDWDSVPVGVYSTQLTYTVDVTSS